MTQIVECVPNISEGRNQEIIQAIAAGAGEVHGVQVFDIDTGADTNRTVITFAGAPEAVLEGAFRLIKRAADLIDMRTHQGAHPRIGATDVCPFIPVSGITMEECAELARRLGKRVGKELGIPVYLYEAAASRPERKNLATIRQGEYEGLREKLQSSDWEPDFGGRDFNAKAGATVIGARPFLIAYNVNLNTKNKKLATQIGQVIREAGKAKRDESGAIIKDSAGNSVMEPGLFPHCKAVGWYIESYGCAQVSINLTDFRVTGMHDVFDACENEARKLGLRVTGSELIGLVPKATLIEAGRHYLNKQGAYSAVNEAELISIAVRSLGLSEFGKFVPAERIIEERLKMDAPLAEMSVSRFIDELASDSVAPGGGSVAALAGALAAALGGMVCAVTFSKPKLREYHSKVLELGMKAQTMKANNLVRLDEDTKAFLQVIAAIKAVPKNLPDDSTEVAQARARVDEAYKIATSIPLSVAESAVEILRLGVEVAEIGLVNALSDVAVAGMMARAALVGGAYNVRINLKEIKDREFIKRTESDLQLYEAQGVELADRLLEIVNKRLAG